MLALAPVPLGVELIIKYLRCRLEKVPVNWRGKIRIKMLTDEKLCKVFHAHQSSIACNQPHLFKGRSHLSTKENMFSETGALRDISFQKNPLVMKTELETNLFWHNSKLLIPFFWHRFCSSHCAVVSEVLVFQWKGAQLVITSVIVCWLWLRGVVPVKE